MKRRLSLFIGLAILASACTDPDPKPLPSPVKTDLGSGEKDMGSFEDMPSDMSLDMSSPVDMTMPEDMGTPEDMNMPEDMGMDMGVDMPVDMCEPKTEVELCAEYGFECGKLEVMECGQMRVVENCGGGCQAPSLCEQTEENGAITGSICRCDESNAEQICDDVGKLCGQIDNLPAGICDTLPACDAYCVDNIAAGNAFNCAIGSGKARCWGDNGDGQLGLGDNVDRKNPDDTINLSLPVIDIAAGGAHTCALLEDMSLICWGENDKGQLGVGTSVPASKPDLSNANSRVFPKDTGIGKFVLGDEHTCALVDTDYNPASGMPPQGPYTAYCWGTNEFGIIGNTSFAINTTIAVPKTVDGLIDNVYDIAAGAQHTCAIVDAENPNDPDARHVKCWGLSDAGQLGGNAILQLDYSDNPDGIPIEYAEYPYVDLRDQQINTDFFIPYPIKTQDPAVQNIIIVSPVNGNTKQYFREQTGAPFEGKFSNIVAGRTFTCLLDDTDQVWCWGKMSYEAIPKASCEDRSTGVIPEECTIWPPMTLWPNFNETRVWPIVSFLDQNRDGSNDKRNVGTQRSPGAPSGGLKNIGVAARPLRVTFSSDSLALPTGAQPNSVVKAKQLAGHNDHLCMIIDEANTSKTNVYCLGRNQFGEVGDGTNSPAGYAVPLRGDVNGNTVRAVQLEIGDAHSCAVVDDNNIKCWGSNADSQIGNENLMRDESFRPFDVLLR
jgi:alpha-tubulin suppressor-like RCC1 family protein